MSQPGVPVRVQALQSGFDLENLSDSLGQGGTAFSSQVIAAKINVMQGGIDLTRGFWAL